MNIIISRISKWHWLTLADTRDVCTCAMHIGIFQSQWICAKYLIYWMIGEQFENMGESIKWGAESLRANPFESFEYIMDLKTLIHPC